jgi:hypothetical protein
MRMTLVDINEFNIEEIPSDIINKYKYHTLIGTDFNRIFKDYNFLKLTNCKEVHHGMRYKTGFNKDINIFNPTKRCSIGGMYFTIPIYVGRYMEILNITYYRIVNIPDDALVYVEEDKFKTNKFILSNRYPIENLWKNIRYSLAAVRYNGMFLMFIINQTYKICIDAIYNDYRALPYSKIQDHTIHITAILQNPSIIMNIKNPSRYVIIEALKRDGVLIMHINKPSNHMYEVAVRQNGLALFYIPKNKQTHKLCKLAVKQNGLALVYAHIRSYDIYMSAVKENCNALMYIQDQSPSICWCALKKSIWAIQFIHHQTEKMSLYAVKQNGYVLHHIRNQTLKVCILATQNCNEAINMISDDNKKEICININKIPII